MLDIMRHTHELVNPSYDLFPVPGCDFKTMHSAVLETWISLSDEANRSFGLPTTVQNRNISEKL